MCNVMNYFLKVMFNSMKKTYLTSCNPIKNVGDAVSATYDFLVGQGKGLLF